MLCASENESATGPDGHVKDVAKIEAARVCPLTKEAPAQFTSRLPSPTFVAPTFTKHPKFAKAKVLPNLFVGEDDVPHADVPIKPDPMIAARQRPPFPLETVVRGLIARTLTTFANAM